MRDTIVGLLMILGLGTAYYYLHRNTASMVPPQSPLASKKKDQLQLKGASHASTNSYSHPKTSNHGKNEGASSDVTEAESLPSIYSEAEGSQSTVVSQDAPKADEHGTKKNSPKRARKIVHGVAVEDWVRSRAHSIASAPSDPEAGKGIRVFLQCMELKKNGPLALSTEECKSLAVKGSPTESSNHF